MIGLWLRVEPHPPAYYLLVHLIGRFAGTSEFALRFGSAIAGPLLVAAAYALARRLAPGAAGWAAALAAIAPFQVTYAQYARPYALAAALPVLAAIAIERAGQRLSAGRIALAVGLVWGVLYLHVLAILPLIGYLIARLIVVRKRPPGAIWPAALVVAIGAIPWAMVLAGHTLAPAVPQWRVRPDPGYFAGQVALWLLAGPVNGLWPNWVN